MSEHSFDAFTRQATEAISRRRSLLALGGAGAALAALTTPAVATAKKKGKKTKKRTKNDPFKKCKQQVEECEEFWEDLCDGPDVLCSEDQLAEFQDCCEFLATCDASEYSECVSEPFISG